MSLVNVSGVNIIPGIMGRLGIGSISVNTFVMDEAADHCGAIIVIPRTGTLTKIGIRINSVTTSDTLKVSLEGVDTANGRPDGVVTPANATGTQSGLTAITYWVPLNGGSGVSVTAGTKVAVTIRWNSYVSGNISVAYIVAINYIGFPYGYTYNNAGTVWTFSAYNPNFGLEYSDGVIEPIFDSLPAVTISGVQWHSSNSPNRRGLRFSLPYKATILGVIVNVDSDGDCYVKLYDSNGTTELESILVDANIRYSEASSSTQYVPFSTPRTLNIDTFYRVVILPASGVTQITMYNIAVTDDGAIAAMNAIDGGVNFHYTTCNNAPTQESDWTQTLTTRPPIALIVSQLDDGAGGASMKVHPGMSGGLNG